MQRQIIRIDPDRCDGCTKCIIGCPEGALQMIDGKARVVSESTCDGLGACIQECPQGAISIETRDAAAYDEIETLGRIVPAGAATLAAHLKHLYDHAQTDYLTLALEHLHANGVPIPDYKPQPVHGCPGAAPRSLPIRGAARPPSTQSASASSVSADRLVSQLSQWPIQLHLVQPRSPQFSQQSVLLVADCVAFALPDFNQKYLPGKRLLVACPKLDQNQDIYLSKLIALIDEAQIESLHVLIMQVPCCRGLLGLAQAASQRSARKLQVTCSVVGLDGEIVG